jgi:hypothetical protein
MFTIETKVVRRRRTRYSEQNPRGSGYCEEEWDENLLIKLIKFRGRTFMRMCVDYEVIPAHVVISHGALGYDGSGWQSKFTKYM